MAWRKARSAALRVVAATAAALAAGSASVAADGQAACAELRRQLHERERGRDALSDSDFLRLEQDYRAMTRLVLEGREEPANRQALLEIAARWGVRCGPSDRRCDFEGLEALYRQQSDARDARRRDVARLRASLRELDCRTPGRRA
jgi:hypothetical protein